ERLHREELKRCERSKEARRKKSYVAVKEIAAHRLIQGDPWEAEKLLTDAVARMVREFGPDHLLTLWMQRTLARALFEEGCFVEAEALARITLELRLRQESDPEGNGRTLLILGRALVQQGKLAEAEPLLQAALAFLRQHFWTKDAVAAEAANWLG